MKKIITLLFALVATVGMTNLSAAKISITLNVDNADHVSVSNNGTAIAIVTGANTLSFDTETDGQYGYVYLSVSAKTADYGLTSVSCRDANGNTSNVYVSNNSCSISLYANDYGTSNGNVYTVTSFVYADLRTAKCNVYVDDASKVRLQRSNYQTIELKNGDNEVAFIPKGQTGAESPFYLNGSNLYQVKINDKDITSNYYSLDVADGDKVTILANYPDVDVPVHFVAGDDSGFITEVKVNDVAVTNWADENFTVKWGSTITYTGNTADYKCDSVVTNGEKNTYFYGNASLFVSDKNGYTIKYYAHKYATYTITIDIDHADRITAYKYNQTNFSSSSATVIPLADGKNEIEMSENCKYLFVTSKAGCQVETFVDAENNDYKSSVSSYPKAIETAAGKVYTLTTSAISRDQKAVFYIDNKALSTHGGNFTLQVQDRNNSTELFTFGPNGTVNNGYNLVQFDASFDNPAQASFWLDGNTTVYFYVNDVKQDASTTFNLTLADGDVLKAYLKAEPATYTVAFDVKDGAAVTDVVRDVIVPVTDITTALNVLTDTKIAFKATGTVLANNTALSADEEGIYSLNINANTTITVSATGTSVENAGVQSTHNVYNLQGVLLMENAGAAEINTLPAGVYIINGKTTYLLQH